ncbi:hypothetical protein [Singulisphaera sp. PoT]|uniref:hypothetical protein n=1 Tax=Singulisphaera sp. PoT TaxID=3411797 RepID=UPI003BF4680C
MRGSDGWTIWVRRLWVVLAILSVSHVPLPVADFHDLQHNHGQGQICSLHNHLLLWHASDEGPGRPVFHVHWVLLSKPAFVSGARGPVFHADSPNPFDHKLSDDLPKLAAEASRRSPVERHLPSLLADVLSWLDASETLQGLPGAPRTGRGTCLRNFGATFPAHHSGPSRLQRWIC